MWTILKRQMELKTIVLVTMVININVDMQAAYCSSEIQSIQNHTAKQCGGRMFKGIRKHHDSAGQLQKANIMEQRATQEEKSIKHCHYLASSLSSSE